MGRFQPYDDDMYSDSSTDSDCVAMPDGSTQVDDSDATYETDQTELSDDGNDDSEDDDLAQLLADNEHPPEYYIRQIEEFDEVKDTEEN
jgi:hypothetical protein